MQKIRRLIILVILCGLSQFDQLTAQESLSDLTPIESLSETAISDGWLRLFDGKSLYGWKPAAEIDWKVKNGAIVASEGEIGLLRTTSQFDDYQLCLEFRGEAETNSGIFLRTSPQPRDPALDCYELNIAPPSNPFPTGSLVGRQKSKAEVISDNERWHRAHIIVSGNTIRVSIDDEQTLVYEDRRHLGRGYIGLQHNEGKIEFRNIFLRPLNLTPMLDRELSLWSTELAMDSKFSVDDNNVLNLKGGRGQIESKNTYADFAFSMRCRTNAKGLNSGVFFRCIPTELMNGYESQIQNEFMDDDPKKPKDCGTGGIFRRINAKKVTANDLEWFSKTIIANGPHISVWVNGEQVTDWSDTRAPNKNPRRGRRIEAGTLILQGHDPTTDIDFADLKVKALTERWSQVP